MQGSGMAVRADHLGLLSCSFFSCSTIKLAFSLIKLNCLIGLGPNLSSLSFICRSLDECLLVRKKFQSLYKSPIMRKAT